MTPSATSTPSLGALPNYFNYANSTAITEADGRRHAPNVAKMSVKYYALHKVLHHTIHVKIGERGLGEA